MTTSIPGHDLQPSLLEASEDLFLNLLEAAPDAIVIISHEGRILHVNSQTEKMFGWSRQELLGETVERLMPAQFHPAHLHHRKKYVNAPHTRLMGAGLDLSGQRRDGSTFPVEISLSPLKLEQGMLVTAIIRDVTERKKYEEEIRQLNEDLERRVQWRTAELAASNESLRREIQERERVETKLREQAVLLDQAEEAIVSCDLDGRILYWNRGAERLYGWSTDEVIGRILSDELYHGNLLSQLNARQQLMETGDWKGELRQFNKAGKEITIEGHWSLVRNEQGQPESILIVNFDVTEKKKLEAQFLRAQRMESIGILAGGIAHDLNNVLSPILMAVQMLQLKATDANSQRLLEMLRTNTERGADLVRQVLSFARGMSGEQVPLQLKHVVREFIKTISQTFPKTISVSFSLPESLWTVNGDATQIHQVLLNLCVNARDAMSDGGTLTITAENINVDETWARMRHQVQPGAYVLLAISDTGAGITPEIMDKIFDPFFTTKDFGKGTGLGLATVASIIKTHGGFVDLFSEPGKGTTFKLFFPASNHAQLRQEQAERIAFPTGQGELILVVDDEAAIREVTQSTLEQFGYRVVTANDGTEAMALFAEHRSEIKLVLTDMAMPYMDGLATARAIRRLQSVMPIIVTSGLMDQRKIEEASQAGINSFLAKPYTAEKLLETVAEVLQSA